ncbi:MAG: glycine cleavage T C-terminal barrel domain-containing protein [Vicinamibacterales bacterium]
MNATYATVTSSAGLWDRSTEGRIEVRGADRQAWLHGLTTNDVTSLRAGAGCYAAMLTAQGRMTTDMRILVREDAILVDVPGSLVEGLLDRLDMFVVAEDVRLEDVSATLARLAVYGPRASDIIADALGAADPAARESFRESLRTFRPNEHVTREWRSPGGSASPVVIARARDLGWLGFDLYVSVGVKAALERALTGAGGHAADEALWETLRIERGVPRFGVDMDEHTIPLEAGIEDEAISFTKGCYVGQEIVVRVMHRGHGRVARRLVGLVLERDADVPSTSAAILVEGETVGRITSATWSPALGRPIALAYVHRDHADASTVEVAVGDRHVHARLGDRHFS